MTTGSVSAVTQVHYERPEVKRAARLMLAESGVKALPNAAYGYFASAFAIRLGATTFQMGLFTACTDLMMALLQLGAAYLVGPLGGRKRMVIATALISALPWLLMALVPFIPGPFQVWSLIPLAGLSIALLFISDPAWGSWMSDIVPVHRRGRFLGLRGSLLTLVMMSVGMGGAAVLDRLHGAVMWGFVTVFLIAMTSRFVSMVVFWRILDPRPDLQLRPGVSPLKQFMAMGLSKLGRYNLFILVFHFAHGMGGPFVGIYLLRDLGVSYTTFVGLSVAASLAAVVCQPLWGRLADLRGNMLVLILSSLALATWPFLFVVSAQIWYLWTVHAITGVTTSGWGIAVYNFVLENSEEETRPSSVGFFNAMASMGVFGGALVGGAIAAYLPTIFSYQMMTLFFLSGILGLTSVLVFLRTVEEPKDRRSLRELVLSAMARIRARQASIWRSIPPFGKAGTR